MTNAQIHTETVNRAIERAAKKHNAEKTLKTWLKANDCPAPSKEDLQFMRSLECKPEFLGWNVWAIPSTTINKIYKAEVFFDGMDEQTFAPVLKIVCDCPSVKKCKHALAVERKYSANHRYLFELFGFDYREARYRDLWAKMWETDARLKEINSEGEAAA